MVSFGPSSGGGIFFRMESGMACAKEEVNVVSTSTIVAEKRYNILLFKAIQGYQNTKKTPLFIPIRHAK